MKWNSSSEALSPWNKQVEECTPIQKELPDQVDHLYVIIIFSLLYGIVWICAVTGNLLVLYIVIVKQVSLSVRTIFIASLAVSDVVMSLTSLPVTAVTTFTRAWIFPVLFCKLFYAFQGGSIFVSSFTLTAIAIDRLLLVMFPNKKLITYGRTLCIVVSVWAIGYTLSLPAAIFAVTVPYHSYCGIFCEESWPDSTGDGDSRLERIYGMSVLTLQFGLPVFICSTCYWKISRVIARQIAKRKEQEYLLKDNKQKLHSRRVRSNRMMVCMVLSFVLAWLPLNLINLSRDFYGVSSMFSILFTLCHVIAMTSAVWNPVIYSWFNPKLRTILKTLFEKNASDIPLRGNIICNQAR